MKVLVSNRLLLPLLVFIAAPLCADLTVDEVLQRIEQAQQPIHDISFDFVMHARQGQFQGKTTGEVLLKKPQHLKVLEKTPVKQTILTDGTTLWLYTPKQKQVLKGDWKTWVDHSYFPLPLMDFIGAFGLGSWEDRYKASLLSHEEKQYQVRFVGRLAATPDVVLWVSDDTFLPTRGDIAATNYAAQVRLKEIRTNQGLKDEEFEPRFPRSAAEVPVSF